MNIEETEKQKQIREISEKNNPYANKCPNWHLWSEGFRSGYKYRIEEQESKPKDCFSCAMLVDNLCQLDVSRCPDCFEYSMWTAEEEQMICNEEIDRIASKSFKKPAAIIWAEGAKFMRDKLKTK